MAASDATPWPIRNQAYRVTFPILDADGDLVTGATGLDSEVSKDGGTFADCTSEATEIATSSGVYYLDLTATEMDADTVAIIVKTSSSGAKTTTMVLYPITNGLDLPVNVAYFGGTAGTFSGGRPEVNVSHISGDSAAADNAEAFFDGTGYAGTNNVIPTVTAVTTVNGLAANVITAASVAVGALEADAFASGALLDAAGVAAAVWNAATASYGGAGTYGQALEDVLDDTGTSGVVVASGSKTGYTLTATTGLGNQTANITGSVGSVSGAVGSVTGNVGGNVTGSVGSVVGAVGSVTGNVGGNVTGSVGSVTGLTTTSIADQVWDEIISGHAISGSTGAALSAAGGSGDPWSTALPGAYSSGTAGYIIGTNINATVSSRASQTSVDDVPTNAELSIALASADDAVLTAIDALPTNAELATALASADDAVLAAIAALSIPTASAIADAVHDEVIEGSYTHRQLVRGMVAALLNKLAGAATTGVTVRDMADTKNRISATVDADGNRTAVTLDLT